MNAIASGGYWTHLLLGIVLLSIGAAMHRKSDELRDVPINVPLVGLAVSRSGDSAMLTMRWTF